MKVCGVAGPGAAAGSSCRKELKSLRAGCMAAERAGGKDGRREQVTDSRRNFLGLKWD